MTLVDRLMAMHHDVRTRARKLQRNHATDPARRTRHPNHPATQFIHRLGSHAALGGIILNLVAFAPQTAPAATISERNVAPGVLYREIETSGTLRVHLLAIDIGGEYIAFEPGLGNDIVGQRERLSAMTARNNRTLHSVVAAVPLPLSAGAIVRNGELLAADNETVSLVVSGNSAHFESIAINITLAANNESHTIPFFNRQPARDAIGLFTSSIGTTPTRDELLSEVFLELRGGKLPAHGNTDALVRQILRTRGGAVIPEGFACLQVPDQSPLANKLQTGALINIITESREAIRFAAPVGPMILLNGNMTTESDAAMALGVTPEGSTLYLAALEYNQHNTAALADVLLSHGATDAAALPSESADLILRGNLVNNHHAAESLEPLVNGALFVISSAPVGPLSRIEFIAAPEHIVARVPYAFQTAGYDNFWNPVAITDSGAKWSNLTDGLGVVSNGVLVAMKPRTTGLLVLQQGQIRAEHRYFVHEPAKWEVTPSPIVLRQNETTTLEIKAYSPEGLPLAVPIDAAIYNNTGEGTLTVIGNKVTAARPGKGTLQIELGDYNLETPFEVIE